jgi:ADP-ribose pyrophosphatase YjhB (NUDIX family)
MHAMQRDILNLLNRKAQTYSGLYKTLKVRSNLFDYHLHKLQQQNLVIKSKNKYKLSSVGQSIFPYLGMEKQPIVAVVLAIFKDNKIVLVKREKHAYNNYWAIPGGKLRFGETFEQAAARICAKETGLEPKSVKYLATVQELVRENKAEKHHFILLLYKLNVQGTLKNGKLFPLASLPKKIVPSDRHMLKITKIKLATSIMNEKKERLVQEFFN